MKKAKKRGPRKRAERRAPRQPAIEAKRRRHAERMATLPKQNWEVVLSLLRLIERDVIGHA